MSGIAGDANQSAAAVPPQASRADDPALAACIALITSDADLADSLAAHRDEEAFLRALHPALRARGVELGDASSVPLSRQRLPGAYARLSEWPLSARRGWQPVALEWGAQGPELVWACGSMAAGASFHEQQVVELRSRPLNRLFAVSTPITQAFAAELSRHALPLKGLVFHMSRCGSTFVAQALKAWRGTRVVSEPGLLDSAILLGRAGHDPHGLLLRTVVAALSQPLYGHDAVVLKLDAWHAFALSEIVAALDVPWQFIYRHPIEVLASHRREPGKHTVQGMLPEVWLPAVALDDILTPQQHAARVLGSVCAAVVPCARRANLVNYDELPQAAARIAAHFGLDPAGLDEDRLAQARMRHAKRPHEAFAADGEAKRAAADRAMYEAAGRWIEPHYRALEEIRTIVRHRRLPIACDLAALRADLAAVAPVGWHAHFNTQYYHGEWSGIALRAQSHGRSPLYADPVGGDFVDTDAMRLCRYVPALLAQFDCVIESVRFLKLAPGAEIREHRDPGLRFEDGVARFHVPVYTNPDVDFVLGGESLALAAGECWYLNFDLPHRIVNRGASERVHLVIDVRVNAWVESLLRG